MDDNDEDRRPFVKDLIQKHEHKIKEVRDSIQCEPYYEQDRYDDLWVLRFLLSHKGKVKQAIKAAKKTIVFRYDRRLNELGDIRYTLNNANLDNLHPIHRKYLQEYCSDHFALMHTLPDMDRGAIIQYYIPSKVNMKKLAEQMSQDDLTTLYTLLTEATYQILDAVTRESGRLTLLLRVVDLSDLKMNQKYNKMEAKAAAIFEDSYPQLVGSLLIVNPPSWFYSFWRMFKFLLPSRLKEKINFASPLKNPSDTKLFLKYLSEDNLPKRYGGKSDVWPPKFAGEYYNKKARRHTLVSISDDDGAARCQGEPQHKFNRNVTGRSSLNAGKLSRRLSLRRLSLSAFRMGTSFRRGVS